MAETIDQNEQAAEFSAGIAKYGVCFVIPYFGKLPKWFPAFLVSCEYNPQYDFLILTDAPTPEVHPPNVKFMEYSLQQLNDLASSKLDLRINKEAYAICDLRPAFGLIFEDLLRGYEWWGHFDIDVIFGRLEMFLSPTLLKTQDIISSRRGAIAGHCTIYRNVERINKLFYNIPGLTKLLCCRTICHVDESHMACLLRTRSDVRVCWHAQLVVDQRELDLMPFFWRWEKGRVLNRVGHERAYLHFGFWKKTLRNIDFEYGDEVSSFDITPRGIYSSGTRPILDRLRVPPFGCFWRVCYAKARRILTGRGGL